MRVCNNKRLGKRTNVQNVQEKVNLQDTKVDASPANRKMGMLSVDLLVTLQILPGFFSNCLFFVLYDSVVLVKRVVSLLSCSGSAPAGEWQRMLTSAGVRSIWNSFLLDAYKQVKLGSEAPNSKVVKVSSRNSRCCDYKDECRLLDFESSDRPLVVNFGSAT